MECTLPLFNHTANSTGTLVTGIVQKCEGSRYVVENDMCSFTVLQSAGCLMKPEVGDVVLLFTSDSDSGYIITVLERTIPSPAMVSSSEGITIDTKNAPFSVSAGSVDLSAITTLKLQSLQMETASAKAKLLFNEASVQGTHATVGFNTIRITCDRLQTVARNLITRCIRSLRTVQDLIQEKSARIQLQSTGAMDLLADRTRIKADKDVNIQGDKIKMG